VYFKVFLHISGRRAAKHSQILGLVKTIEELNKEYAVKVLEMFGDNKSKAAEVLGISRTSLWRILKEE
jgi:transcriptional regulator with PAS, ATPase and Fis domain